MLKRKYWTTLTNFAQQLFNCSLISLLALITYYRTEKGFWMSSSLPSCFQVDGNYNIPIDEVQFNLEKDIL